MQNKNLLKYSGLAAQFIATLGVAFFVGLKIDQYVKIKFPIFTLIVPLLVLIASFWKIYNDTSNPSS